MANPIISVPKFPNVPNLPGVPQLIRANQAIGTVQLAVGAIQKFLGKASKQPAWGVFDSNGKQVVNPDSVLGFDNSNDWRVSDFPLQDGQFASYNKVICPYEASVKMSKGGSLQDRKNFLDQIAAIAGDTNLYTILTPERSYVTVNIRRYSIRRMGRNGAYFFADVEIYFRQIRQVNSQYSSTSASTANSKNPPATPAQNLGTQFPQITVPPVAKLIVTRAVSSTPF